MRLHQTTARGCVRAVVILAGLAGAHMPEGLLKSFVVDAVINGLGAVLVFLPQILILFFFILILEESGYLPRAAFMLDKLMSGAGLTGRSFIPLLSSHACAIPGIMATRSQRNAGRDDAHEHHRAALHENDSLEHRGHRASTTRWRVRADCRAASRISVAIRLFSSDERAFGRADPLTTASRCEIESF